MWTRHGLCACVSVCVYEREGTDCVCVCREKGGKKRIKVCVYCRPKPTLNSFIPSTPLHTNQWAPDLVR